MTPGSESIVAARAVSAGLKVSHPSILHIQEDLAVVLPLNQLPMNGDLIATLKALRSNLPRLASDFDSVELAKGFFARLAVDVFTIYY